MDDRETKVTVVGSKDSDGYEGLSEQQCEALIRDQREVDALRSFGTIGYEAYVNWILTGENPGVGFELC